jgi:copper transport protein
MLRKLVTVAAATAVVALVVPAAASAHATLIRSNPTDGAVLAQAPGRVTLQFSEPVETSLGAISVLDANLRQIQIGRLAHPAPDTITAALPPLPRGSYLVTWRVVSADTHAVHGTLVFSIGTGSGAAAIAARG